MMELKKLPGEATYKTKAHGKDKEGTLSSRVQLEHKCLPARAGQPMYAGKQGAPGCSCSSVSDQHHALQPSQCASMVPACMRETG